MIARVLVVAALLLAGVYVGYAVLAGYVGAFPEPVNLVAGLACPVALAAVGWRVATPATSTRQTEVVTGASNSIRPVWVVRTAILVLVATFVAYVAASFLFELIN